MHLPRPEALVPMTASGHTDALECSRISGALRSGTPMFGSVGYSTCRICGIKNGRDELTNGTYVWPDGLVHYVEAHGVVLPAAIASDLTFQDGPVALDSLAGARISVDRWLELTA